MLPIRLCSAIPDFHVTSSVADHERANELLREAIEKRTEQTAETNDEQNLGPDGNFEAFSQLPQDKISDGETGLIKDSGSNGKNDFDPFLQRLNNQPWLEISLSPEMIRMISHDAPHPAALAPLDQCILDILWEIQQVPNIFHGKAAIPLVTLRAAALYQAKIESVRTGQVSL